MSLIERLKTERFLLIGVIVGAVLAVGFALMLWSAHNEQERLAAEHSAMMSEHNTLERDIATTQAELDKKRAASVKKATGVDPSLIEIDVDEAKLYFEPAFSWKSYDDYERVRTKYMESLGKDNSFTKKFMPKDRVIDTSDGELSYIDFKRLKATMHDMFMVPVKVDGDKIEYVGVIEYYMHRNTNDTVDLRALDASHAIVEFTVAGNPYDGTRTISNVSARAGYASNSGLE